MKTSSPKSQLDGIVCHCDNCPGDDDIEEGICYLKPGGQCFSAIEEVWMEDAKSFEAVRTFGCISAEEQALLQCKGDLIPSYYGYSIKCCNNTDMCNKHLLPQYTPRGTTSPLDFFYNNDFYFVILTATFTVAVFSILAILIYLLYKRKKEERSRENLIDSFNIKLQTCAHNTFFNISTSGSGVGKSMLIRTSISRQVNCRFSLGRGRYTEVNVVKWNSSKIVEKIFLSQYTERWLNEKRVYEVALLRHDNVLGYISSDIMKSGLKALYTDYYELGSLHSYLDKTCLNYTDFFKIVKSAANGVVYLHTEIIGTSKRPAVAHCDITSKNFFVNNNKECVISNFEVSVIHISTESFEMDSDFSLVTSSYMAPEAANGTSITSFDSLKMIDIYSLGLVFYEICQRCATVEGNRYIVEEHSVPLLNFLPKYPTTEDVRKLYARGKLMEDYLVIPTRWENNSQVLKPFLNSVLRECLYETPTSRPTALRVKKNIETLESSNLQKNIEIL